MGQDYNLDPLSPPATIPPMIYVDVSAAVHARAGLGRYSENLANALIAAQPDQFGLFYNQGQDGRFPPLLPTNIPTKMVQWGVYG